MKNTIQKAAIAILLLYPSIAMASAGAAAKGGTVTEKTFIDVYHEGGWCMHFILAFSVATVWLVIDIWIRTNAKKMTPEADVHSAQQLFLVGDYVGAYAAMKLAVSPFAQVVRASLGSVGYGKDATEEALHDEIDKINTTIQTRINYLSVIGVCTPMVGLLGTVSGMKGAFGSLGTSGIGDPAALAGHIGEVLVATASGLFVAIPAFMGFYFLRNKLQSAVHELQNKAEHLFRHAPYEYLKDVDVGQEVTFAAIPNWVSSEEAL
jgi:biopolymer transport protein ExbB